jgi:hypothetical protein
MLAGIGSMPALVPPQMMLMRGGRGDGQFVR